MDHQALRVPNIRKVREELNTIDESLARLKPSFYAKAYEGAVSGPQILLRQLVAWMILKAGIIDPRDERMVLQETCHLHVGVRSFVLGNAAGRDAQRDRIVRAGTRQTARTDCPHHLWQRRLFYGKQD